MDGLVAHWMDACMGRSMNKLNGLDVPCIGPQ